MQTLKSKVSVLLCVVGLVLSWSYDVVACPRCGLTCVCKKAVTTAKPLTVNNNVYLVPLPVPTDYKTVIARQGATQYGSGAELTLKDYVYQSDRLALLARNANQALTQANNLSGELSKAMLGLAQTEFDNHSRIAEIIAKKQAVVEAFRAVDPTTSEIRQRTITLRATLGNDGKFKVEPTEDNGNTNNVTASGDLLGVFKKYDCVRCHSGAAPKGGLNLLKAEGFGATKLKKILSAITTRDDAKRMPPPAENGNQVDVDADDLSIIVDAVRRAPQE